MSGSHGIPKGVVCSHDSAVEFPLQPFLVFVEKSDHGHAHDYLKGALHLKIQAELMEEEEEDEKRKE